MSESSVAEKALTRSLTDTVFQSAAFVRSLRAFVHFVRWFVHFVRSLTASSLSLSMLLSFTSFTSFVRSFVRSVGWLVVDFVRSFVRSFVLFYCVCCVRLVVVGRSLASCVDHW